MIQSTLARPEAETREAVVVVQALSKTFRDFWMRARARAVDNLSFHINRGEIFGLLGPNGSGKSTSIKIILGLLRPSTGRVAVFGRPPTDVATKKRVGYLPEESYLYPFLNARETLDYYGKLFQLDYRTRRKRIDELLDMVGLAAVQHRAIREYSKGMQRRIGIAQALVNDPEFLILDEPTTGLDPIGTKQIKDLILELGRRGKSILLSSHLLADVEDCVDRMVILYGGKAQREGTCEQLLSASAGSVITTDDLDEATIAEIDEVIRRRSGGERSILRVARPRQRLEDLFVQIVDEARARRLENSGAQHGGELAGFLRATPADGRALIDRLVAEPVAPAVPNVVTPIVQTPTGPDRDVLEALTRPEPAAPVAPQVRPPLQTGPAKVIDADQAVINSLLGGTGPDEGKGSDAGVGGGGGGGGR